MGWAIKRADGTYRCWNRHSQDDILQLGETWEERDLPPRELLTPPVETRVRDRQALLAHLDSIEKGGPLDQAALAALLRKVL